MLPQLFESREIRLAAFDAERDPELFSKWTHDSEYMRLVGADPARPLAPFHIKKQFEAMEKEAGRDFYYFVIRTCFDNRAIGFAHLHWIEWNHGNGRLEIGIGSASDRRRGYGSQALETLMRYAFHELNLFRLTVNTFQYNDGARKFLERHGFQCEVRRREAIYRDGRYWDALLYGILASEWSSRQVAK